jgi:hypothetical protein
LAWSRVHCPIELSASLEMEPSRLPQPAHTLAAMTRRRFTAIRHESGVLEVGREVIGSSFA